MTGDRKGVSLAELSHYAARVSAMDAQRNGIERDDDWFLIKLQEELGELAQAHLRLSRRERGEADETSRADEAADLFCQLLVYCRRFGIDLEGAISRKWTSHLPQTSLAGAAAE